MPKNSKQEKECAIECKTIFDGLTWIFGCIEGAFTGIMIGCYEYEQDDMRESRPTRFVDEYRDPCIL